MLNATPTPSLIQLASSKGMGTQQMYSVVEGREVVSSRVRPVD
jgi:hypothetical protein